MPFLPTAAMGGTAAVLVLLAYTGFEVRRADISALRALSHLACLLSAAVLGLLGVFLLMIGFPAWFAGAFLVVAGATWALRGREALMLSAAGVGTVALALFATKILVTAPGVAAAATGWLVALVLHLVARHELTGTRAQAPPEGTAGPCRTTLAGCVADSF